MKRNRPLLTFAALTACYLTALLITDARHDMFARLPVLASIMPVLMGMALLSFFLRYLRWHYLLQRAGQAQPFWLGFYIYLSGFAYTATPGKVGELIRIRYLQRLGISHEQVLSAFIYERGWDLLVVLLLTMPGMLAAPLFPVLALFVGVVLLLLAILMRQPRWLGRLHAKLRWHRCHRSYRLMRLLRRGMRGGLRWLGWQDLAVAAVAGVAAWSLTATAFVWLVESLSPGMSWLALFSSYPLAMLAGAASMLPGGIGSTESVIVGSLLWQGGSMATAVLAAVGIRFATMWFAVLLGMAAIVLAEWKLPESAAV
ncbi:lysylphosphatidylglycerol synthase transmembrane domain-containing protein [Vogesella oryzae]|uniref:lysylphosphatidylglycerol synthase transmembrane domain-containing protein n=1 Tax=Vogesella oryzae TaxID=1735285 RepID=UPI00158438B4|nr:lysylphosphatidylglycerol synthase transmembrane domain-containing protein [Vogesella oryzae]